MQADNAATPAVRSTGHAAVNTLAACQTKNVNSANAAISAPMAMAPGEPVDIAANAMKLSGTSSVAISRIPRLVVGSFQRCSLYKPTPNSAAVTAVKSENLKTGRCEISPQKLMTSAIE